MFANCTEGARRRVLIVDQSAESREVLRTVLEQRGVEIYEAQGARIGLDLAHSCDPDLIVLDLESVSDEDDELCDGFNSQSRKTNTPLVMLGSVRRLRQASAATQFVPKPYHYGPLIRKIEGLLDAARQRPAFEQRD